MELPLLPASLAHPVEAVAYLDSATISFLPAEAAWLIAAYHHEYASALHPHKFLEAQADKLDSVRQTLQRLIRADRAEEIVLTRSATEAINIVAHGIAWQPGDEILLTDVEHLANELPWRQVAQRYDLRVRTVPATPQGQLEPATLEAALTPTTRLVTISHVSNVYGGIQDLEPIVRLARQHGALSFVDGAQAIGRIPVDVQALGCNFYAGSGRKALLGSIGTGFLYGRLSDLQQLQPMIGSRSSLALNERGIVTKQLPVALEGGLPSVALFLALKATTDALLAIGLNQIQQHIQNLTGRLLDGLSLLCDVEIYAEQEIERQAGIVSFKPGAQAPRQISASLHEQQILVGAGNFGTRFLASRTGSPELVRVSLHGYNTAQHIDRLLAGLD